MKKIVLILGVALTMAACSSNSNKSTLDTTVTTTSTTSTSSSSSTAVADTLGAALIKKNDCLTCHQVNQKIIGPAYIDVANKYTASEAVIDTLANKVIKGGSGNWGEVAMSPHPSLSITDSKEMIKYILSLKK